MYNLLPGCRTIKEETALLAEWLRAGFKSMLYMLYQLDLAIGF